MARDRFGYKGFLVVWNMFQELWYISREGFHIGTAHSEESAKAIIDQL